MEEYGKEYREKLEGMGRMSLLKEANKMRKRLNKLSGICDVEDVYNVYAELKTANESSRIRKKESEDATLMALEELKKRGVDYGPGHCSLKKAIQLLIDSSK